MRQHIIGIIIFIFIYECIIVETHGYYDSSFAYLFVKNEFTEEKQTFCVNYEQWKTQQIAKDIENAEMLRLGWWGGIVNNTNVCNEGKAISLEKQAVALNYRLKIGDGPCAFPFVETNTSFKKALQYEVNQLASRHASAAIILVDKGHRYITKWADYLFSEFHDPDFNQSTKLPTFFMYRTTFFDEMLKLSNDSTGRELLLQFYRPLNTRWDISMLIIWLIAVFCVAVCVAMNDVTQSIFRRDLFNYKCCTERPLVMSVMIFFCALSFCITWFVFRRNPYAFILLDFINIAVCIHILKGIRFPNLKVAAGTDCSKSGGNYPVAPINTGIPEKFPILFQLPRLSDPVISCIDLEIEKEFHPIILGLGDVVVPGYGIGLIATFIALTLMETAQPALIYLIPFTLAPIIILALIRQEFKLLWTGNFSKSEESHISRNSAADTFSSGLTSDNIGFNAFDATSVPATSSSNAGERKI
ncbi:unnamed protein product [Onchocerca ochengi]|uniref:PA domain-containing protein n=1 Tax=Onchocerca ochengi TaxID=42157 RepID=A0A182EEZ2_ONCOC|nr:unnamed protein product [Onchocerca ochengi]